MSSVYTKAFYDAGRPGMQRSAKAIVPYLCELLRPQSVIDVGCGEGWWLSEFGKLGVSRLVGVEQNVELIAAGELIQHDLEHSLVLNEQFDLCLCLETAEHLSESRAHSFVQNLCHLSDVVVFSAAIPRQGGNNHINEQWQSYWAEKFMTFNFEASGMLRDIFWEDKAVEVWYRQNIILFWRHGHDMPVAYEFDAPVHDVVHPQLWGYYRGLNA